MNPELEKQLEALIGKISNKEDFDTVRDQLLKRGIESLLKAEMTAHLGYEKGSSGIGGYGVELQGEKEGIADVPIAEKGTKVFTLNGEPLKELTSIYGPELPGGSTALIPDGDGFSHQNDNYTNLVEKEVEKLYTAKGQLKPNSSLGKDPDSDKSAEYGGIGAGYPTKDRKSAEKDSSYFDKSNYFEKIWIETETID